MGTPQLKSSFVIMLLDTGFWGHGLFQMVEGLMVVVPVGVVGLLVVIALTSIYVRVESRGAVVFYVVAVVLTVSAHMTVRNYDDGIWTWLVTVPFWGLFQGGPNAVVALMTAPFVFATLFVAAAPLLRKWLRRRSRRKRRMRKQQEYLGST